MNHNDLPEENNEAGKWESLYIHLIANSFDDKIEVLAEKWDEMPGLNLKQQEALRKVSFLREHIEKIAYIKRHKRMSEHSPCAAPLENFLIKSMKSLWAHSSISEQTWINALGLGNFNIKVAQGEMSLEMPPALQKLGIAKKLITKTPGVNLKVPPNHDGSTRQPYLKADILLGPLEIEFEGQRDSQRWR